MVAANTLAASLALVLTPCDCVGDAQVINGKSLDGWREHLKHSNPEERAEAARVLGYFGVDAVPPLAASLRDDDDKVRRAAAFALGRIGPKAKDATPALLAAMKKDSDPKETLAFTYAHVLAVIQPRALHEAVRDADPAVRWAAVAGLSDVALSSQDALSALRKALKDPSNDVRRQAAWGILRIAPLTAEGTAALIDSLRGGDLKVDEHSMACRYAGRQVIPFLLAALKSPDDKQRENVLGAFYFHHWDSVEVVNALGAALEDANESVREHAARGLYWNVPGSLPIICAAFKHKDKAVRLAMYGAFQRSPSGADPFADLEGDLDELLTVLEAAFTDPDKTIRKVAAEALWVIQPKGKRATELLSQALQNPDPTVRRWAAEVLPYDFPPTAPTLAALRKMLAEEAHGSRHHALHGLWVLGKAGIPVLREALRDPNPMVRRRAATELAERKQVIEGLDSDLLRLIDDPAADVRVAAVSGLSRHGRSSKAAGRALLAKLSDKESSVRRAAAWVLGHRQPLEKETVEALRQVLDSEKDLPARVAAAWALAHHQASAKEVVQVLRQILKDPGKDLLQILTAIAAAGPAAAELVAELEPVSGHKDKHIRRAAAQTLGNLGAKAVPVLLGMLNDPEQEVRREAVSGLINAGAKDQEVARLLRDALAGANEPVQFYMFWILSEIDPDMENTLCQALRNSKLRAEALRWLPRLRPSHLLTREKRLKMAALFRRYLKEQGSVRVSAVRALGELGSDAQGVWPDLAEALRDPESSVRTAAADALAQIGPLAHNAVPALVQALRDRDSLVRQKAAEALGAMGAKGAKAETALREALDDQDPQVYLRAMHALGEIGASEQATVDALVRMMWSYSGLAAVDALAKMGRNAKAAIPDLLRALRSEDLFRSAVVALAPTHLEEAVKVILAPRIEMLTQRYWASQTLSAMGSAVVPHLAKGLVHPRTHVRLTAARALAWMGPEAAGATGALTKALKDPHTEVRIHAAQALNHVGAAAKDAAPALRDALNDELPEVRFHATLALAQIDPAQVPAALKELRQLAGGVDDWPPLLRLRRHDYLSGVVRLRPASKSEMPHLLRMLQSDDWLVRENVITTLGELGALAQDTVPLLEKMRLSDRDVGAAADKALRKIREAVAK